MSDVLLLVLLLCWFAPGVWAAVKSAGWTPFKPIVALELLALGPIGLMIAIARGRR